MRSISWWFNLDQCPNRDFNFPNVRFPEAPVVCLIGPLRIGVLSGKMDGPGR